ncbi:MAG: tetratricopeptide repeat protein [Bacteroidales bacterium]|nr:tetratricopeptide repeat protein [Bacteroidales bacterium]
MNRIFVHLSQKVFLILFVLLAITLFSYSNKSDSLKLVLENQQGDERISTLMQLSRELKAQPEESLKFAKEAYSLSDKNNYEEIADISYVIADKYTKINILDSADKYYGVSLSAYKILKDTLNIMRLSTIKGYYLQRMGLNKESGILFKNGIDLFGPYWETHEGEAQISKKHLATMMTNYGISLFNIGKFDSSVYYHTESYKIKVEIETSPKNIAKEMVNIGNVYSAMDKNIEAIKYFNEANESFIALDDNYNIGKCYNNIGLAYKRMGDTIKAISNYEESLNIRRKTKNKNGIATNLANLSSLYFGIGETKKAENALLESLELSKEINNKQLISLSIHNLANIYFKTKLYKKALEYAHEANEIILETNEMTLLEKNYSLQSKIYEALGNYKLSLEFLKLNTEVHDSLFNADNTQRFNELQTEFETAQKEKEIELLKKEQENQKLEYKILKNRQHTYFIVIVLIIILFAIIIFAIILKRKKDRQILKQKELFHKKEKELAEAELEKSKLKEKELEQSVQYKSKQLSTHALHMMQKNTILQEIQGEISDLRKKADINEKPRYKQINQQINQSLRSDNDWDVFKLYFEEINKNFYEKLKEINPELTTNDHRLCALIKLNMNSKEMASVLNISPNSIKSARYRLKKKLGLEMEADLEEFIRQI